MVMHANDGQAATWSARQLAEYLAVSLRHVRRMDADGLLPEPLRLGRCVRWLKTTIDAWLAAGCPCRNRGPATAEPSGAETNPPDPASPPP